MSPEQGAITGRIGKPATTLEATYVQPDGSVMIVGGGTGLASLMPLAEYPASVIGKVTFLIGAKTKEKSCSARYQHNGHGTQKCLRFC